MTDRDTFNRNLGDISPFFGRENLGKELEERAANTFAKLRPFVAKKYANLLGYNYQSSKWYENSYKVFNKLYKTKKIKKTRKIKKIKKLKKKRTRKRRKLP